MNKKNKKGLEKSLSLLEISILIVSIIAFSYFVGNDFKFVSAAPSSISYGGIKIEYAASEIPPISPVPSSAASGIAQIASPTAVPTSGVTSGLSTSTEQAILAGERAAAQTAGLESGTGQAAAIAAKAEKWSSFVKNMGSNFGSIMINAGIAIGLYFGTYYLAKWAGANEQFANALGLSLSIGYGAGAGLGVVLNALGINTGLAGWFSSSLGTGLVGLGGGLIGLGIGALLFLIFYRETIIQSVQFTCYPWQPVTGGNDCVQCGKGQFPCTEYKCKSLGASCELVNQGTDEEACTWNNKNDVNPPIISAWKEALSEGYEYKPITTSAGDKGVEIKSTSSSDGCIPAFTRLTYGVSLDKMGRCKIDTNRTSNFESMSRVISSGYFLYIHSLISAHGGLTQLKGEGINLANGGNYEVHVRCESTNGNANAGTFVFKYCVQDEPDTTAPKIELTNPLNNWFVENGKTSQEVNVYTDKPADCKWSHNDESYDSMPNTMTCSQSITEMNANTYYQCHTTLNGLKDQVQNKFYFNCKSYPLNAEADRYTMATNYQYTLTGTNPLVIDSITPLEDSLIKDSTQSVKITLTAKTSAGYNEGQAYCDFKNSSESDQSYVMFANTNSYSHSQDLWLDQGHYKYTIKCCDIGELSGNCEEKTTNFDVETDFEAPIVVRVYNENNELKVITNEEAECVYGTKDCSYEFKDGIKLTTTNSKEHSVDWNTGNNFYVKCKDKFGNEPAPDECSIIARPFSSY
jgi:hypothetical protein